MPRSDHPGDPQEPLHPEPPLPPMGDGDRDGYPPLDDLPPIPDDGPDLEPFEDPLTEELDEQLPLEPDDDGAPVPRVRDPFGDEPDEWTILERDHDEIAQAPGDRVVLPWSMRAEIPALAMQVPAILDPTRADSEWIVPRPPDEPTLPVRIRLGPVEVRVTVTLRAGDDTGLRLGRDALGDVILVRSTP